MSNRYFPLSLQSTDCIARNKTHDWRRSLAGLIDEATGTVRIWLIRHRTRRALRDIAEWNAYRLTDIGLSRAEAFHEASKPFWRK